MSGIDLSHHGDADVGDAPFNFAVNVHAPLPPSWLREAVCDGWRSWALYPDARKARDAIAAFHRVAPEMVLPTAGGSEGFALVAAALDPDHPVVVHPQFTEAEQCWARVGKPVWRHILRPGFSELARGIEADLVLVGNPTNPTGVLHRGANVAATARPGATLVVDEAFMDTAARDESLIAPHMPNRLVLRSLTKAFSVPGIRAGYIVGDPSLIERLTARQSPWSVSAAALSVMTACCSPRGSQHLDEIRAEIAEGRADLIESLRGLPIDIVDSGAAFCLLNTSRISSGSLWQALYDRGCATRRGETFPGLGPQWLRVAVRDAPAHRALAAALADIAAGGV